MEGKIILDREQNLGLYSPICHFCEHRNETRERRRVCKAFSDGIPEEIWLGQNDHRKPYPGDLGIVFKKRANVSDEVVEKNRLEALSQGS